MKKLALFIAIAVIGLSSCKKDEVVTPVKFPTDKVADRNTVGTWD